MNNACFELGLGHGIFNCSKKNVRGSFFRSSPSFLSTQTVTPVQTGAVPGCYPRTCRPGNLGFRVDEVGVGAVGWVG